ncbi:MAG TPA: ATP-binding protein [Anaeromyxobacter sp.]
MSAEGGRLGGGLRSAAAALRVSRFELKISAALVLAATVPFVAAIFVAGQVVEQTLSLGLDPRVVERLTAVPSLYGELFQARKQLYAQQTLEIARALPRDPARAPEALRAAMARTPRLRRAAWYAADGRLLADVERPPDTSEGEWRDAPARATLPGGGELDCTFEIEARFFAELDESRELAELVQGLDALRAEIRRTYVRSFAALVVGWAVVAAGLGIFLARRTTRRVSALVGAVRRLAGGDLDVQVEPGRANDEVAGLARAFNAMVREVRESRDRIVYLEKISGWQEVARRLAHEIKNPLTPLKLAFQQLDARWRASGARELDPAFGARLAEAGEVVRDEIGTLQRLVDEFSSFAKLPEVRPDPADLGEFVDDFLRTSPDVSDAADVDVVKASADTPVRLDRTLMRRVLANLCANAIDAARPARARIHVGVARSRERAVLTVADEGPGIDRATRERIFDPYYTTKKTGTGLGLAIVKKIVLQHGGEIQVGDRPGGGASFSIALPLRDGA